MPKSSPSIEDLEARAEQLAHEFADAGVSVLFAWAWNTRAPRTGGYVVEGAEHAAPLLQNAVHFALEDIKEPT